MQVSEDRRIVICINDITEVGGAEQFIENLSRRIRSDRFAVTVLSLRRKGSRGRAIENNGWDVRALNLSSIHPANTYEAVRAISAQLRKIDPDGIVSFLFASNLFVRIANFWHNYPLAIVEQNLYVNRNLWQRVVNNVLVRSTDEIIAISESVRRFLIRTERLPPDTLSVIPNGIDLDEFQSDDDTVATLPPDVEIDPGSEIIISVASLTEQKGHVYLLEAFREILSEYPEEVELLLVGDGELEDRLKDLSRSLKIDSSVHFLGNRNDVSRLLTLADLYVMPSLWEGQGMSLQEAMASGLPCVVSDIDTFDEFIDPGNNGLLSRVKDPESLADQVLRVLRDDRLKNRLGRNARDTVKRRFDLDKVARQYESLFERLRNRKA